MSTKKKFSLQNFKEQCAAKQINASLPLLLWDKKKQQTVYCNQRMKSLFKKAIEPSSLSELEEFWPFFNEELSPLALLDKLLSAKGSKSFLAEATLKSYRVHVHPWDESSALFVAEMLRSGDLLSDVASRQVLFRSLSHELRTAVMSLEGYLQMLEPENADQKHLCSRMQESLRRLNAVVERLKELRVELS